MIYQTSSQIMIFFPKLYKVGFALQEKTLTEVRLTVTDLENSLE